MNPIEDGGAPLSCVEVRAARTATLLVFLLSGAGFANWVVRIPAVKTQLGLSESELGLALFGVAVGAVCVLPIVPLWLERSGSRKVIGISLLAYAAALILPALASNAERLFAALIFLGAAMSMLDVAMNAHAALVEERIARPIMSSFHAAFSFGALIGAAMGGWAVHAAWSVSFHLLSVALVIAMLGSGLRFFLLVTPPAVPEVRSRGLKKEVATQETAGIGPAGLWRRVHRRHRQ